MQFFCGISRNTQSKSYMLSLTKCVWDFQIMYCGIIANMPYFHRFSTKRIFLFRDYAVSPLAAFQNLDLHCKLCAFLHENPEYQRSYKMSERYSKLNRCFDYHHNLDIIKHEPEIVYNDEFKGFLPIKV